MSNKSVVMTRNHGEGIALSLVGNTITLHAIRGTVEKMHSWDYPDHATASLEFEKNELYAAMRGFVVGRKNYYG